MTAPTAASGPILVIESDPDLRRDLAGQLLADDYSVESACTAEHARALARSRAPRLIVLGGMDSRRGAVDLLQEIRTSAGADAAWQPALPVIVIGPADQLDVLRAFDAGADDFLARPAPYIELRARLRAVLRRTEAASGGQLIEVGALTVDLGRRSARIQGRSLQLRRLEFELLVHLARDPQRVFSKSELLRVVWGYRCAASTRTVDSHASRLRRKLDAGGGRSWVVNVWGVGYRLI